MGCLNSIFKMWPDKSFVQGEKSIGSKGREGSFQVKQHPTGFIGIAGDIIFSSEPGVLDNSQVFGGGDCWYGLGVGWVMVGEGVSDEMGGVKNGKVLAFGGIEGPAVADV